MSSLPLLIILLPFFQTFLASSATDLPQAPISLDPTALTLLWDPPSPNATDHLIFSSASSLLHTWRNARYRNGHTIVPGTIPKGTLLHHGTSKKVVPATPEWTAFDPELSYMFCHTARDKGAAHGYNRASAGGRTSAETGGCWHLTLRTTRPLNILYFDGSAAVKAYGPLDAQDVIVFGDDFAYDGTDRDSPFRVFDESERLRRLCQWGRKYNLDGFVRMQSSFEVMLCDFAAGLEELSFLNLVSELEGPKTSADGHLNGARRGPEEPNQPTLLKAYSSIESGLRHGSYSPYSAPETRVHLDLTRLISFYDAGLFPSLVEGRARVASKHGKSNRTTGASPFRQGLLDTQLVRGRWRVGPIGGMSREDRDSLMERLDEVLHVDQSGEAGAHTIDWTSHFRHVKDRYAERLEILHYILSTGSKGNRNSLRKTLVEAHMYLENLLTPYILYGVRPPAPSSISNHSWATPILETCANHYVPSLSSDMTASERLLISGLRGTTLEICRVLVKLWAIGVESSLTAKSFSNLSYSQLRDIDEIYANDLTGLTSWLDWSTPWIRCTSSPSTPSSFVSPDGCSFEESCYLPTWPFFHNVEPAIPGLPPRRWPDEGTSEWEFPQPRCIRRVFPLHLP